MAYIKNWRDVQPKHLPSKRGTLGRSTLREGGR